MARRPASLFRTRRSHTVYHRKQIDVLKSKLSLASVGTGVCYLHLIGVQAAVMGEGLIGVCLTPQHRPVIIAFGEEQTCLSLL